jgi:hypothetical protein
MQPANYAGNLFIGFSELLYLDLLLLCYLHRFVISSAWLTNRRWSTSSARTSCCMSACLIGTQDLHWQRIQALLPSALLFVL